VRKGIKAILRRPAACAVNVRGRLSARKAGIVVLYHRVGPDPPGCVDHLDLCLASPTFEAHMRLLKRRYRVVPASELQAAVRRRKRFHRFPAAITFDDDSPTHARTSMPILARLRLPAIFFVCGRSLEQPHSFWWERMELALGRGTIDEQWLRAAIPPGPDEPRTDSRRVRQIAADVELMAPEARDAFAEELGRRAGPDPEDAGMREADIRALSSAGFEVGFHTARHYNLTVLDDGQLAAAMREGREEIERVVGERIDAIAYPGGRSDRRVVAAARAADFGIGFTTSSASVLPTSDPMLLGRLSVPNDTSRGRFAFRMASILRHGPPPAAGRRDAQRGEAARTDLRWSRRPALAAPWLIFAALIFVLLYLGVGIGA